MKKIIALASLALVYSCTGMKPLYPETKKVNHTDEYFGEKIQDPYRWLEDDRAEDTKAWVNREIQFTQDYLAKIPYRKEVESRLTKLWNYEKISAP